jgi:hypothetical protein
MNRRHVIYLHDFKINVANIEAGRRNKERSEAQEALPVHCTQLQQELLPKDAS